MQNTKGEPKNIKTSVPATPHTRAAFHRRLQPLYTEKHTVLCSGFLPKTSPMQYSYRAITLRFAAARAHSFSTSPLLLVTTSLSHHPSSPPFAAARAHSFSTSPLPFVTTALSHHFTKSPSFVTTLRHHPSSSPFVITSPQSPLPSNTTLRHQFP